MDGENQLMRKKCTEFRKQNEFFVLDMSILFFLHFFTGFSSNLLYVIKRTMSFGLCMHNLTESSAWSFKKFKIFQQYFYMVIVIEFGIVGFKDKYVRKAKVLSLDLNNKKSHDPGKW